MNQSRILSITGNGTYNGNYGMMYKYEMNLENGNCGEYMSKSYTSIENLPFKVGDVIEYEFQDGDFPKIKKPRKYDPNFKGFQGKNNPKTALEIARQSSLQRSLEYLTHNKTNFEPKEVITLADYFADFVINGLGSNIDKNIVQKINDNSSFDLEPISKNDDDLPF